MFAFNFQPTSLPFLAPLYQEKLYTPILHQKSKAGLQHNSMSSNSKDIEKSNKLKSLSPLVLPYHY
jgi:hypothetical protein